MRCDGSRNRVGFPDIHLCAARPSVSSSSISVVTCWGPSYEIISIILANWDWVWPSMFATPSMNLMSCGHWESQYPVPYLAPATLVGNRLYRIFNIQQGCTKSVKIVLSHHTTVCIHLGEVECTVKTTRKRRDINIEGKFLVDEVESLVLSRASGSHEVETWANVLLGRLGDEFQSQSTSARGNTVCA